MPVFIQPSFAKGEIAPALYGRVDVAAYQVAVRRAYNMVIHPAGGISNRPGTEMIAPVKDHSYAPRLIDFKFKETDAYVLEFGDEYIRVIRDDGHVLETSKEVTSATSDPVVLTIASHGYTAGQEVAVQSLPGLDDLVGRRFRVGSPDTDTFALLDQVTNEAVSSTAAFGGQRAVAMELPAPPNQGETGTSVGRPSTAGYSFVLSKPVTIRALAVYDLGGAGLANSHSVGVWTAAGVLLASVTVPSGTSADSNIASTNGLGSWRAENLSAPVTLQPGTYVIGATYATDDADFAHNQITPSLLDPVDGLTFLHARWILDEVTLTFPNGGDLDANGDPDFTSTGLDGYPDPRFLDAAFFGPNMILANGSVARVYTIPSPYAIEDVWTLKYEQSADVMTLTHPSYPVHKLSRTGHATWTLAEPPFQPSIAFPTTLAASANTTGSLTPYPQYQVTAIKEGTLEESLPAVAAGTTITGATAANPIVITAAGHGVANGDEVAVFGVGGMVEINDRRFRAANVTTDTLELQGEDGTNYTAFTTGGTIARTFVQVTNSANPVDNTVTWDAVAGAVRYAVYKEKGGLYGLIGETQNTSFLDANFAPDLSLSPPQLRTPFRVAGEYPGANSFYEQRAVYGGSVNKPDTSFYSRIGDFDNFTVSSPLQDDDAITAVMPGRQVNEIRHYVPLTDLIVLTGGAEWRVNSGPDTAFSASTIKQKAQTHWGASHNRPIVVGNTILYVQENQIAVRSLGYTLQSDGYTGTNISLLASHLFGSTRKVKDWAFAKSPDSVVHVIREDGKALALTFDQEQEVIAWTQWETAGSYEAVASIRPSADYVDDCPYFVVKRTINGRTVRYIERQRPRRFETVEEAFFVDCGVTFSSEEASSTITGLWHLEGENVSVLADGNVISSLAVENGQITLPRPANLAHIGLPYTAEVETLDVESPQGTIQGRKKKISTVTVRFEKSRGLFIGPNAANLQEMKQRENEVMGAPTELLTGDNEITLLPHWNSHGRLLLRQPYPLPMTILALIPDLNIE